MSKVSPYRGAWLGAILGGGLFLLAFPGPGLAQAALTSTTSRGDQTASVLRERIVPPHDETLKAYADAGAKETKAHVLTDREWALVEGAIADLPELYRRVLERRLARLSFVDAPSSLGTALTRASEGPNGEPMFDITIRAEVLDQSLSAFLTQKEAALFSPDGSDYSVRVAAGDVSALTYILLHEATHVIDRTLDVTAGGGPFKAVWADYRSLAQPYAAARSPAPSTDAAPDFLSRKVRASIGRWLMRRSSRSTLPRRPARTSPSLWPGVSFPAAFRRL